MDILSKELSLLIAIGSVISLIFTIIKHKIDLDKNKKEKQKECSDWKNERQKEKAEWQTERKDYVSLLTDFSHTFQDSMREIVKEHSNLNDDSRRMLRNLENYIDGKIKHVNSRMDEVIKKYNDVEKNVIDIKKEINEIRNK